MDADGRRGEDEEEGQRNEAADAVSSMCFVLHVPPPPLSSPCVCVCCAAEEGRTATAAARRTRKAAGEMKF
jgi:hypothetical protein